MLSLAVFSFSLAVFNLASAVFIFASAVSNAAAEVFGFFSALVFSKTAPLLMILALVKFCCAHFTELIAPSCNAYDARSGN
jgi:hypothetical protein